MGPKVKARYFPVLILLACLLLVATVYYLEQPPGLLTQQSAKLLSGATGYNFRGKIYQLHNGFTKTLPYDTRGLGLAIPLQHPGWIKAGSANEIRMWAGAKIHNPISNFIPTNEIADESEIRQYYDALNPAHLPDPYQFATSMARNRLRFEMSVLYYNGSAEALKKPVELDKMKDLLKRQRILILTYFRGGTTFFGEVLSQYPGVFYHFEPFHMITVNDQIEARNETDAAMGILRNLLNCNYANMTDYLHWVQQQRNRFLLERNKRFWRSCQFTPHLCMDPTFLSDMCTLHPIHVFKIVRLRMIHLIPLMKEFADLKVIHLVRDPRGLYASRRDLDWCSATNSCINPHRYCGDMDEDLQAAQDIKERYPKRFRMVRYEDIAVDPQRQFKDIFQFLGFRKMLRITKFIEARTNPGPLTNTQGGPYSTRRDSKSMPYKWRNKLNVEEIDELQQACFEVIRNLGYGLVLDR